jgi:Ca-activated chloride channel family protein
LKLKATLLLLLGVLIPAQCAIGNPAGQEVQQAKAAAADKQSPADDDDAITTIRASVQEVNLIFTATDRKGHFKRDLRSNDVQIVDDGKPPVAVRSFRSETDLPLRVGLVLDVSGSITDRFTFEQDSAIRFFNQMLRQGTDQAFVLAFDSTSSLTQDFTDKPERLAAGVKALTPGGGSAVYDAVQYAAIKKLMNVHNERPMRKVIILISDGEDNQSRATRSDVIDAARRAEATVYAISTNTANTKSRGDKVLEHLAEETGGRVFFPNKLDDVIRAFTTIQDELRSQYAMSYKPADLIADGRYRRIEIHSQNDKNVIIRARKGYFAPSN